MLEIDEFATRKKVQETLRDYLNVRRFLIKQTDDDFYTKYPEVQFDKELAVTNSTNYDEKLIRYLDRITTEKKIVKDKIKFQQDVLEAINNLEYDHAQFIYLAYIARESQNKIIQMLGIGKNKFYSLRSESERSFALLLGIEVYIK